MEEEIGGFRASWHWLKRFFSPGVHVCTCALRRLSYNPGPSDGFYPPRALLTPSPAHLLQTVSLAGWLAPLALVVTRPIEWQALAYI